MRTQFIHSFRWNVAEVILYQGGLLFHQWLLFQLSTPTEYGIIGTAFGTLYLASHIINGGLDIIQDSLFSTFSRNQEQYRSFFHTHIITTYAVAALSILAGGLSYILFMHYSPSTVILWCLLLLTETVKRTAKNMVKLLFHNKQCTYVETIGLIIYLIGVWGSYIAGFLLTLSLLLLPLTIVSICSTVYYTWLVYQWYSTLPRAHYTPLPRVNRLAAWVYQSSKQLSSSNFLVSYLGLFVGLEQAGLVSMVCNLLYSINSITQHTLGSSLIALLVQSQDYQQSIVTASKTIPTALFFTFVWCVPILYSTSNSSLSLILACAALTCIEQLWVYHEKLFVSHKRTGPLIIATLALPILLPLATLCLAPKSPHTLLIFFVAIRFFSCCYLVRYAQSLWHFTAPRILLAASFILILLTFTAG